MGSRPGGEDGYYAVAQGREPAHQRDRSQPMGQSPGVGQLLVGRGRPGAGVPASRGLGLPGLPFVSGTS